MLIAQISDPHVSLAGDAFDRVFTTAAHLERAVRHLCELSRTPDFVIVSGDCVEGGTHAEYERFRALIRPLGGPVYVIPGNHDDRGVMREVFGPQGTRSMERFIQYVVEGGPVRMIALDSHVPGRATGFLCAERLGWLEERLDESAAPTLIVLHHPPFRSGIPALDALGLGNAEALGAIVARHPNVECVAAGHLHRSMHRRFHGALALVCPSTAHAIELDLTRSLPLTAVMEPPGCVLHLWDERAGLVSHVSPIGRFERVGEA